MAVVAVVMALLLHNGDSCKDNGNSNGNGGSRSGGSGGSGDGGGNDCSSALGNLPLVNDVTILLMTVPTRLTTLTPLQWPRRDERQRHMRRGRGWAMMQCHLLLSVAVAAMDQSKLPEDNGGRSPHEVIGQDGQDQSNNDDGRHWMGRGTTRTALQSQKTKCVGGSGTGMTIELDRNAMQ
jgi:hypothetical protein